MQPQNEFVTVAGAAAVAGSAVVKPVVDVPPIEGAAAFNAPLVFAVFPFIVGTVVAVTIIPK